MVEGVVLVVIMEFIVGVEFVMLEEIAVKGIVLKMLELGLGETVVVVLEELAIKGVVLLEVMELVE